MPRLSFAGRKRAIDPRRPDELPSREFRPPAAASSPPSRGQAPARSEGMERRQAQPSVPRFARRGRVLRSTRSPRGAPFAAISVPGSAFPGFRRGCGRVARDREGVRDGCSFCVALRSEPFNFAVARQPFVDCRFIFKAGDISSFCTGATSLDLPVALCNSLGMKRHARRFAHVVNDSLGSRRSLGLKIG